MWGDKNWEDEWEGGEPREREAVEGRTEDVEGSGGTGDTGAREAERGEEEEKEKEGR